MKIPICVIERFAYNRDKKQYDSIATNLDSFNNVNVNYGYKDKKDTFSVSLLPKKSFNSVTQSDDYTTPNIDSNDLINIYVYYEDDPSIVWGADGVTVTNLDKFLLFNGIVDKFSYTSNEGVYSLSVTGNNRTEILLNNMVFFQYNEVMVPDMIAASAIKFKAMNVTKPLFMNKDYKGDGTDVQGSAPQAYKVSVTQDTIDYTNIYNTLIPGSETWGLVPRGGIRAYKDAAYEYDSTNNYWKLRTDINLFETNSDGLPVYMFTKLKYYETYKSLYSHLEVLSGTSYTYDYDLGVYITYVTNENNLIWKARTTFIDATVLESETSSTSVTREIRDVVNAAVINAGSDAKGRGILALSYNTSSMSEYGAKWKYKLMTNLSDEMMLDQKTRSGAVYNDNNSFPETYPVKVCVPGASSIIDSDTKLPIWEYTILDELTSDAQFNLYVRRISRELAKTWGTYYTTNNAKPRFFCSMKLDIGSVDLSTGDLINVQIPSVDWDELSSIDLRVQEVKHSINANGWNTTLTLEQDNPDEV